MSTIWVTLETVTPLFLGGALPRGEPELRAASVRGALRFWLRALLGGILGDQNLDTLRTAEAAVFGSTDTGASPVAVRVRGNPEVQAYRPLLHNPSKTFTSQGIKPGEKIALTVAPRPPHSSIPEAIWGSLLMLVLLGGLGKRSRRGFGTFVLRSANDGFPMLLPDYSDADSFSKQLPSLMQQSTKVAESLVQALQLSAAAPDSPPTSSIIHEEHTKVLFCKKPFPSWEEAMKSFWSVLRDSQYRDNRVFGFANVGRQASPLHLRIVRLGNAYHLLLTAFHVDFPGQQPSWKVMQRFLDEGKQKWDGDWIFGGGVRW